MQRVLRVVLLVIVVILSFFTLWFSSKTDNQKFLAPLFLFLTLVSMTLYALLKKSMTVINPYEEEASLVENDSASEKRSLEEFETNRCCELKKLLDTLDVSQSSLHTAIGTGDIKKISDAEKNLNANLTSVLDFFENYSNFGKTIHFRNQKK